VRADHLVLVEQGQLAVDLEHALDHEHDVGAAGIIFVEHQSRRVLQRPRQDALAELGHLLAVAQHDRILADQVDTADVAVEVDAQAGPVEARRDLLDMGRLAGAVVALDHDSSVVGEARKDRHRRVGVEQVGVVHLRHVLGRLAEGRDFHVRVDAEELTGRNLDIRHARDVLPGRGRRRGHHVVLQNKARQIAGKSMIAGRFVHRKRPIAVAALNRANHSAGRCSDARRVE
jgi:hypothetical protein